MTKQMCDLKTISEYLDLSIPYIRKLVRAKLIPHYRFGNRLKFDVKEIKDEAKKYLLKAEASVSGLENTIKTEDEAYQYVAQLRKVVDELTKLASKFGVKI